MVTDRFFDGNESNNTANGEKTYGKDNEGLYHGGDFAGVTKKLDYLKDLGINTIWMTPIVENIPGVDVTGEGKEDVPYNASYHGYWASDFEKLNPELGTKEEFESLISEAHKRGMKIMVDIVVNHAGYDTEDKFGDMLRSGEDVLAGDDQKDSLSNLPDFKTEDPTVRETLVKWQTNWMKDYGIDYYRVDTVKHVESTTWAALKNSTTAVNPAFKMIGEYSGAGYASNGETLGTGQMDSDLDFDFNDQATQFVTGGLSAVEKFLTGRNSAINNTYLTGQFLSSHDEVGFKQNLISDRKMTENQATAASLVAATLQITAKGQPVVYYGEEVGQTGENNYPYQTNRYDLDWAKANTSNKVYNHYKKLLNIRKDNVEVFARGDRKTLAVDDTKGYDIVSRTYNNQTLVVGMNTSDKAQTVAISGLAANANYKDLYSGATFKADKSGKVSVVLPASVDGGTVILAKTADSAVKVSLANATVTGVQAKTYTSKAQTQAIKVTCQGKTLVANKDYKVTYANNVNVGNATVTITGIGAYAGTKTVTFAINPAKAKVKVKASKTSAKVTVTNFGGGDKAEVVSYNSKTKAIKVVGTVTKAKPSITIKKLKSMKSYTYFVRAYKTIGTKKVYGASTAIKVVTTPGKVSIKSAKKKAAKLTVKWSKLSGVTGYQIKIAKNKNFSKAKSYTVKKASTTKKVITKLSKKGKYYAKVRAYKVINGKKVYGAYSKVK